MTESELHDAVRALCQELGLRTYHSRDSRREEPGWPDLVIWGDRLVFRELKSESGRLSLAQRDTLRSLERAGQNACVWRPADLEDGLIAAVLRAIARPSRRIRS